MTRLGSSPAGSGSCTRMPSTRSSALRAAISSEQRGHSAIRGQAMLERGDPGLAAGARLAAYIDLARRVVPDQDRGQAGHDAVAFAQPRRRRGDLLAQRGGQRLAVDQPRHPPDPYARCAGLIAPLLADRRAGRRSSLSLAMPGNAIFVPGIDCFGLCRYFCQCRFVPDDARVLHRRGIGETLDAARLAPEQPVQIGAGAVAAAGFDRMADPAAVEHRLPGGGVCGPPRHRAGRQSRAEDQARIAAVRRMPFSACSPPQHGPHHAPARPAGEIPCGRSRPHPLAGYRLAPASGLAALRMVAAGMAGAVLARLRGLAADQLVEIALLAAGGLLLVQQREVRIRRISRRIPPTRFPRARRASSAARRGIRCG